MRREHNIGYNPLLPGSGPGTSGARRTKREEADDFQVIEVDDDEVIDLSRLGKARDRPDLQVATKKLEEARAAKKK